MVNNWQRFSVAELILQKALVIGDGYRAKNAEFRPVGLPFARIGNIASQGELDLKGADRFPESELKRVGNKVSQPGDIVFTSKGTVGHFLFVKETTERFLYSPQLSFWRIFKRDLLDPRFIFFWMQGREFHEQIYGLKSQTDMADYVSLSDQRRIRITLPPLPIQRRIAEILGRLDDKIEVNRRINRTLEQMAQALYQHWFVDFGPFQNGEFVESELGPIPKGWEVKRIKDVAKVNPSSINKGHEPESIVYVDIASVSTGSIDEFTRLAFADAPSRARRLVTHGDIIWSAVRPNRRSFSLIQHPPDNLVVSTGFAVVRAVDVPCTFLYTKLATQEFTEYLVSREAGAAYPAVQAKDFENADILIPTQSVLNEFHRLTEPWFEQRFILQQQNAKLATIRDYLLPKLLSGAISVEAGVEQAAEATHQQLSGR